MCCIVICPTMQRLLCWICVNMHLLWWPPIWWIQSGLCLAGDPGTGAAAQQGQPITLLQGKKTCWVLGKDQSVCDIFAHHGSISREHAVVQFKRHNGVPTPYIMDLESVNGTHIATAEANEKLEPLRYYRLLSQDTVRLGGSSRDYVFIDENDLIGK